MSTGDDDLFLHRFYANAQARPDAIWLTQPLGGGRVDDISFARGVDEARRMAAFLRSLRLAPQSRIAILSKNTAHFFLADLAIWMAGHVSVPLYPTLDTPTARFVLEHSHSRLLFVGQVDAWGALAAGVPQGLPRAALPLAPATAGAMMKWNDVIAGNEPIPDWPRRKPDEWATIVYTSGTTGRPKGAIHTFATISASAQAIVNLLGMASADRMLSYLPLAHVMDRWLSECGSLVTGARVYFAEGLDTFVEDLKRARPTIFVSVPRLWLKFQRGVLAKVPEEKLERMLRVPIVSGVVRRKILRELGLDHARFAGSGSAPIPPELLVWWRRLGLELIEGYGMTENFAYSHVTHPGRGRPGYVGHPYDGVECRLGDDGEVLVKSPGAMLGYLDEPALTRDAFTEDGFLRTGDLGVVDEDGRLKITGRKKELFKSSKGKYVAPAPIENLLNRDGHLELSLVAGAGQAAPHAVVQLAEPVRERLRADDGAHAEVTRALEALLEQVNSELPSWERLSFLAVAKAPWNIEDGSLTPTMKLRRSVLEARYAAAVWGWYASGVKVVWEE